MAEREKLFNDGELYKMAAIREVLKLSQPAAWRLLRDHHVPAIRLKGRNSKRYNGTDLNELMEKLTVVD